MSPSLEDDMTPAAAEAVDPSPLRVNTAARRRLLFGVPETGPVLFVLYVDDEQLAGDGGEAATADMWRLAEELAPGRSHLAVLTSGLTLDVLTDEQLAPIGLQHIPEPTLQVTPSPTHHAIEHPAGWHM